MATLSDGENSEDDGIAEMPEMTWDEASNLLASPRVGDSGSDTEDEAGYVMARPASHGGEAGDPRPLGEDWMNQATRHALDLALEEAPAPDTTPLHTPGVVDSAGELTPRGSDGGVREPDPVHGEMPVTGETTPAGSGGTAPAAAVQRRRATVQRRWEARRCQWTRRHRWRATVKMPVAPWLPVHRGSLGQPLREGAARRRTVASPIHHLHL